MRVRYSTVWLFSLFLSLTDFANCFTSILGISSSDIAFVIGAGGALYYILKFRARYWEKSIVLLAVVLILTSSFQALYLYGQPIFLGIRAQRAFLCCWLVFVALEKMMVAGKITFREIRNVIYSIVVIQGVICLVQQVVGANHYFMTVLMRPSNYFGLRIYVDMMFVSLSFALSLNELLNKNNQLSHKIILIIDVFIIVFVSQSRMGIISFFLATFVPIMFMRGLSAKKIVLFFSCLVAIAYFLNSEMANTLFEAIRGNDTFGSITTRYNSQDFYLGVLAEHPILGGGYINSQHTASAIQGGITSGYLVVDNGIYGFAFLFGIPGLIWALIIYGKMLVSAFGNLKNRDYFALIVLTSMVISLPTSATWYYEWYSMFSAIVLVRLFDMKLNRVIS